MRPYRHGFTFDLGRCLRYHDTSALFADVDLKRFLEEIAWHLVVYDYGLGEIEMLLSQLHHQEIIDDYMFSNDAVYVNACAVVAAVCRELEIVLDLFDTRKLKEQGVYYRPKARKLMKDNYAILFENQFVSGR